MSRYFSFQWHITDACDQRCKHCYIFNGEQKQSLSSMNWDQMESTLENCLDFCRNFSRQPYIYLTGGDPILHPDFWKLLERLKKLKIPFTILGNPYHLTDEVCRDLKTLGCLQYQLSLDGMEKTHDWFRKLGSFNITIEKIDTINRAGIKSAVMSTISKTNYHEIPDLIDTVVKAEVGVYAFSRYIPNKGEVDSSLSATEYRNLLEICDKKFKHYQNAGVKTKFNKKDHLWCLYEYETGEFVIPKNAQKDIIYAGCNCGNSHLTILPNGDVYACRRVDKSRVGSVFNDKLTELWLGKMEAYRDFDAFTKCRHCELKSWCRGCPAVAKAMTGDFYGADPQCWKKGIQ